MGFKLGLKKILWRITLFMATPIPPVDPNRSIFGEDFSNGLETADFRDRALSRDHIEECRDARVTCVRHCKDPAGVEHEALEFQIEVPDSDAANPSRTVYLFVDRVGGSPAPSRTSSSSSLQPSNSSKETITSSGNLSSSYPAVDRLILACYTKSRFETVATLTIPKHVQFSVVNAIALIVAMSQSNIIYNIQSANCYWYAGGISAAIAGRYDLKSEVGNSKMKSGHFGSLKVNDPSRISQEKLLEAWIEHENAYAKLLSLR